MDRFSQFAVAAAKEALAQAKFEINPNNQTDLGVYIGSGIGGLTTLFEQTRVLIEKGVTPLLK